MSDYIPPFKPRPPMSKAALLSFIRRRKIFPNYVRLPTTNTACARLRLHRKHTAERKRQTGLIMLLEKQLEILSSQLSSMQAAHHAQLSYLQTLAHPVTVQNHNLDTLSHPLSTFSETRTMFSLRVPSTHSQ